MNRITIDNLHPGVTINKNIYGHFSEHLGRCVYGGLYVGENSEIPNVNGMRTDVVEALKDLELPVLRWPGGCFADEYHWEDGIGPKENRKRMVNTNWGYVVEDNSFGTHEFLELCRQIGCEPYICGNVGSGTVREMAEWVEYLNSEGDSTVVRKRWANGHKEPFHVKYWGVGNESWGCGGEMRPEFYADEFRRYQTYCRKYGDDRLYKIACGPSSGDTHWTEVLMREAGRFMSGLSMHYYTLPTGNWSNKGSATEFDAAEYYETIRRTLRMEDLISAHSAIMDRYDPDKRVGLIVDEWGTWYNVEPGTNPGFLYQQNTMRDAVVAAINFNIFNHHADRVQMANIAQIVNVLQAVILTEGSEMVLTPTYHAFHMYKPHMNAQLVKSQVSCDQLEAGCDSISASASVKDGKVTVTMTNIAHDQAADVELDFTGHVSCCAEGRVLAADMAAYNTFENKECVKPAAIAPEKNADGRWVVHMPACSVVSVTFDA